MYMHEENQNNEKKLFSIMSNLQTNCSLKLCFKKWTNIQEACKWLVHSAKHRKDNQLPSLELPCRVS